MNDPVSTDTASDGKSGFFHFRKEEIESIKLVVFGGMLGGLLQPAVAQLNPSQSNPSWPNIILGPILGIAAAGISVFVLANSRTDDRMRLLFFSLLCGLAFPAVLTGALDSVSPRSQVVEKRAEEIATTVAEGETSEAAAALAKTMRENPTTADVDRMAEAKVDKTADAVVADLASKAESSKGANADKAIGQLEKLGTAARAGGYDGTAIRVNKALRKIEASPAVEAEQREHAGKAADGIIGLQPTPAVEPGY